MPPDFWLVLEPLGDSCRCKVASLAALLHTTYHSVTVVQAYNQLLEEPPGLLLPEPILLDNILKHVTPRCKLHCNPQVLWGQEHLQASSSTHVLIRCWHKDGKYSTVSTKPLDVNRHPEDPRYSTVKSTCAVAAAQDRCPHLFELHDMRVNQASVVEYLTLHVLGNLQTVCACCDAPIVDVALQQRLQTVTQQNIGPKTHLVPAFNELARNEFSCLLVSSQLNEAKRATVQVSNLHVHYNRHS